MATEKRIFLTLAVLFFLLMHWSGWNETSHFVLTRAIVEEGRIKTTSFAQETGDRIRIGNDYYSDKNPGLSFLAVPIHFFSVLVFSTERPPENKNILIDGYYFLQFFPAEYLSENKDIMLVDERYGVVPIVMPFFVIPTHLSPAECFSMIVSTFFLSGLLTVATAYLLFLLSKEFVTDKRIQYLVPIGYALGTLAFSQALVFQRHAAATFFCFAAFFVGYYTIKKGYFSVRRGGFLAGILMGIAFLLDPFAIFVVMGIGFWLLLSHSPKTFFWYGVAFVAVVALLLAYNFVAFGNSFSISYSGYSGAYIAYSHNQEVETGFSLKELIFRQFYPPFFKLHIMTIIRLLVMPERGILFYFPFLFLVIPGIFFLARQRPALTAMVLIIFFSFLWVISTPYGPWWGNASFGPRHLTFTMPFLMIPIMFAMKRWHISISLFLITVSIFINVLGLQLPSFDLDKKFARMDIEEYNAVMTSLTIIENPLVDYYWLKFREHGINMPLINSALVGRPFDIRSNMPLDEQKPLITSTPFGSLFISRSMLPFLVITLVLSFIWFGCLKKTLWRCPLIVTLIILVIFSFHLK